MPDTAAHEKSWMSSDDSLGRRLQAYRSMVRYADDSCSEAESAGCETAVYQLFVVATTVDFRAERLLQDDYARKLAAWKQEGGKDAAPVRPIPSYPRTLAVGHRYLDLLPKASQKRRDLVLHGAASALENMERSSLAMEPLGEIASDFPQSRHHQMALLKLGEASFSGKRYDSAVSWYSRLDTGSKTASPALGLALYHKAESLHELRRDDQAVDAFLDYLARVDRKAVRGDLRDEAVRSIGMVLSSSADPVAETRSFLELHGRLAFADTILHEEANRLSKRGRSELSVELERMLLERWPRSALAPSAQLTLVDAVRGLRDSIAEARELGRLRTLYGPGGTWWPNAPAMTASQRQAVQKAVAEALVPRPSAPDSAREVDMGGEAGNRSPESILRVIRANLGGFQDSYQKYLRDRPNLGGKISLKFRIAPSGEVAAASVMASNTGSAELDQEIKDKVMRMRFDRIEKGNVTVTYSFVLDKE